MSHEADLRPDRTREEGTEAIPPTEPEYRDDSAPAATSTMDDRIDEPGMPSDTNPTDTNVVTPEDRTDAADRDGPAVTAGQPTDRALDPDPTALENRAGVEAPDQPENMDTGTTPPHAEQAATIEDKAEEGHGTVSTETATLEDTAEGVAGTAPMQPATGAASVDTTAAATQPEGLWPDGAVDDLRRRWDAIQLRFVDDPPAVAADAKALVAETIGSLQSALSQRERELDEWSGVASTDTEELRQLVSRYRRLFESLIS